MGGKTKPKQQEKKRDWQMIALVLVVATIAVLLFVFGPRLLGGGPEFSLIVHYQTQMDPGVPSGEDGPGNITVTGDITNIGTEGGTPVVHILIGTGYSSQSFDVEAAPCAAGAHVTMTWTHYFSLLDPQAISIECSVDALDD